jgi:eukaryotic-like serine/threonine-protein kinase
MTNRWERLTDLYHAVAALPEDDRASLLTEECADDPALQADIERLVAAHDRASRVVASPALALPAPGLAEDAARPAVERCGPYRLLRTIGRGQKGAIHLAVREDGRFDQRVAIELFDDSSDAELVFGGLRALTRRRRAPTDSRTW